MVTWSLETQPRRSQRILKPGTPSQNIKLYSTTCFTTGSKGGHSVFGSPAPQIPKNPKPRRHLVFLNSAAQIPEHPKAVHPTPICYHEMNEPCSDAGWGGRIQSLGNQPRQATSRDPKVEHVHRDARFVSGIKIN